MNYQNFFFLFCCVFFLGLLSDMKSFPKSQEIVIIFLLLLTTVLHLSAFCICICLIMPLHHSLYCLYNKLSVYLVKSPVMFENLQLIYQVTHAFHKASDNCAYVMVPQSSWAASPGFVCVSACDHGWDSSPTHLKQSTTCSRWSHQETTTYGGGWDSFFAGLLNYAVRQGNHTL